MTGVPGLHLVEHPHCRAHLARGAVSALERILVQKRLLYGMQTVVIRQTACVVICAPSCATANVKQVTARRPSRRTVHDPHCPWSHPFFGDVTPSRSRSASSSVVRVSTVRVQVLPSTVNVISASIREDSMTSTYPAQDYSNRSARGRQHPACPRIAPPRRPKPMNAPTEREKPRRPIGGRAAFASAQKNKQCRTA